MILLNFTKPQTRLSWLLSRLSPMTNTDPGAPVSTEIIASLVVEILEPMLYRTQLLLVHFRFCGESHSRLFIGIAGNPLLRYGHGLVINEEPAVDDLNLVTGKPDDALDEVFLFVFGIFENDDLTPFRLFPAEDPGVRKGDPRPVHEFVHEQVVADGERGDHGTRRDLERLYHELAYEQGHYCRDKKRFYPFLIERFLPYVGPYFLLFS